MQAQKFLMQGILTFSVKDIKVTLFAKMQKTFHVLYRVQDKIIFEHSAKMYYFWEKIPGKSYSFLDKMPWKELLIFYARNIYFFLGKDATVEVTLF
jgi:hypothetical protein